MTHTVISVSFIFNTLLHRDTAHTGHRCQIKQNEKIVRKFHEQTNERTNERTNALSVFVNLEQQKHRVSENTLLMLMCTTLNFQQHSWRPMGKMSLVLSLPASKPSLSPRLSPPVSLSLSLPPHSASCGFLFGKRFLHCGLEDESALTLTGK